MTFEVSVHTRIAAPAERVWDFVTDWERQGDWVPATTVRILHGDGRSVGSRLLAFTGFFDIGFADPMEIVEWDPPRRCVVRHTGRLLRGTGEFAVEAHGEASAFVWSERLEPPLGLVGRFGLTLLAPAVRLGLSRAGDKLAAECEWPSGVSGS
jgi:carbon monoxide dehydrogenase subunit G